MDGVGDTGEVLKSDFFFDFRLWNTPFFICCLAIGSVFYRWLFFGVFKLIFSVHYRGKSNKRLTYSADYVAPNNVSY